MWRRFALGFDFFFLSFILIVVSFVWAGKNKQIIQLAGAPWDYPERSACYLPAATCDPASVAAAVDELQTRRVLNTDSESGT